MSKTLVDAKLTTPTARERLPPGLHWRELDPDVHLGYRKAKRAGRWLVRWRQKGRYRQSVIGTADDVMTADGLHTHTYVQASERRHDVASF